MNCLKFRSVNNYIEETKELDDKQKIVEARKSYLLSTKIKRDYNLLRSHVYLEFGDVLIKSLDKPNIDLAKIRQAIERAIKWCETYFNISLIYESIDEEDETVEIAEQKVNEAALLFVQDCYSCFNSLVTFCSEVRELSKYLLKTIFNEVYKGNSAICVYGDEFSFETDEDVKKYERQNCIEPQLNTKDILNEVVSVFEDCLFKADVGM